MKLSIVSTLYQSEPYIKEFYDRIITVINKITTDYEIIFVNDGSPDNSLEACQSLLEKDSKIKIIDLSRNFGHHQAMMTGLKHAQADYIFLIDCDLEEAPEELLNFYNEIIKSKADVIYGVQEKRNGSFINKLIGKIYYKLLCFLTGFQLPENILTIRLMTKRYVNALASHQEKALSIGGVWHQTGFQQKSRPINKRKRKTTTYCFRKRIAAFFDSIISFSHKPLVYIFNFGLITSISALIFSSYILFRKLVFNVSVSGWTSLMMSVWLLGGLIIFFLGVISLYIAKIFTEVKARPLTIVKEIYYHDGKRQINSLEKDPVYANSANV